MGKTNEQTKHIDTGNRLVVARGRDGGWEKWEKKLRDPYIASSIPTK